MHSSQEGKAQLPYTCHTCTAQPQLMAHLGQGGGVSQANERGGIAAIAGRDANLQQRGT